MTIALDSNKVIYTGNGVTTIFPFSFRVDTQSDLQVYLLTTASGLLTALAQGVDYTIAGVPGAGSITYNPLGIPMPATEKLIIMRVVPLLQGLDINNQGGFYPEAIEGQLDDIVMGLQQLEEGLGRTVKSPVNGTGYDLPLPEADTVLMWNSTGTGLVNRTLLATTVALNALWTSVLATATTAAAWAALQVMGSVPTRALLKALPVSMGAGAIVYLNEGTRCGYFWLRNGAIPYADPGEGVFIASDTVGWYWDRNTSRLSPAHHPGC